MKTKYWALASAAILAVSAGLAMADDQDEEVRRLNLEQLEKARAANAGETTAPIPAAPDGQGGPEYQAPPIPDEGMTDEPPAPDEGLPTPDEPEPETEPTEPPV